MVLWLIEEAQQLGLPYVYLGYWIENSPKMAYKARFQPLEHLNETGWERFDPKDTSEFFEDESGLD